MRTCSSVGGLSFIKTECIARQIKEGIFRAFVLCSEIPVMPKECFNKDRKLCKSSKCLDNEAMKMESCKRDEFLFILSLLNSINNFMKSLISSYLESIETG